MNNFQNLAMYELGNDNCSVITLGQLRQFVIETCKNLSDNTPIMLNAEIAEEAVVPCIQILADESSVEFYNF